jgi:hypothetical protein
MSGIAFRKLTLAGHASSTRFAIRKFGRRRRREQKRLEASPLNCRRTGQGFAKKAIEGKHTRTSLVPRRRRGLNFFPVSARHPELDRACRLRASFINYLSADVTGSFETASAGPRGRSIVANPPRRRCRDLRPCLESHFRASRIITAKRIRWPKCAF